MRPPRATRGISRRHNNKSKLIEKRTAAGDKCATHNDENVVLCSALTQFYGLISHGARVQLTARRRARDAECAPPEDASLQVSNCISVMCRALAHTHQHHSRLFSALSDLCSRLSNAITLCVQFNIFNAVRLQK